VLQGYITFIKYPSFREGKEKAEKRGASEASVLYV
jgi:hypothetical protein